MKLLKRWQVLTDSYLNRGFNVPLSEDGGFLGDMGHLWSSPREHLLGFTPFPQVYA